MKYNHKKIEAKWQKKWLQEGVYEPDLKRAKKPFYNLTMFPYPSAEGLHVGNMYDMVGCDIFGRLKRMQRYDVFQPIGLDGFGIHSENYALKIGKHPMLLSKITEKRFYKQIAGIGSGFAWKERLETYDSEYYRWTQWVFIRMFKRGLAYRKKALVNWCPQCLTVLADEQVIAGECERCGTTVVKKELEQWFFKITDYAERLLKNLEKIDWSEKVKIAQKNWIGKSEGALVKFQVSGSKLQIEVFTTRADTVFGATYLVLAPEHPLVPEFLGKERKDAVEAYIAEAAKRSEAERLDAKKIKTGVFTGSFAVNPANGEKIPVWVADYVLSGVGTGAIMAVPAHDERDFEFAKKFNLPVREVISDDGESHAPLHSAYTGEGKLLNSGWANGFKSQEARRMIAESLKAKFKTQFRLRDWLISRQRYWGPPIPMIFCESCRRAGRGEQKEMPGWYAVAEKDLPVLLPFVKEFRPTGTSQSPLASVESFYRVKCPRCSEWARRETDVSDTFLDSAWYYYRYIDVGNKSKPFDRLRVKKWLPVDRYMGGFEHAVLHLLYTRFITMVFYDFGIIGFDEPFKMFRAHGHITKDGAKMSKSRGNVVNPDEYIHSYGADALRMYLMFLGPFEQGGDFRDTGIRGVTRFLERVWKFVDDYAAQGSKTKSLNSKKTQNPKPQTQKILHQTIKKVTEDIENLQYNTAISALMVLLNEFEAHSDSAGRQEKEIFLKLLAPFAPHITEELWYALGNKKSVHTSLWPKFDKKFLTEDFFALIVQVNGKVRATVEVRAGITEEDARAAALSNEAVKRYVPGVPRKVIFVKNKLINFVV
ncbi:MAG: leucine--tRNA ligase [Candidatus Sungbacteria bacterium]|nr:leucine--tRNA ligase [Candidatus Sungbacteria bacterium]